MGVVVIRAPATLLDVTRVFSREKHLQSVFALTLVRFLNLFDLSEKILEEMNTNLPTDIHVVYTSMLYTYRF